MRSISSLTTKEQRLPTFSSSPTLDPITLSLAIPSWKPVLPSWIGQTRHSPTQLRYPCSMLRNRHLQQKHHHGNEREHHFGCVRSLGGLLAMKYGNNSSSARVNWHNNWQLRSMSKKKKSLGKNSCQSNITTMPVSSGKRIQKNSLIVDPGTMPLT